MKEYIFLSSISDFIILERFIGNRFDLSDSHTMQKKITRKQFCDELMIIKGIWINGYFDASHLIIFRYNHN